MGLNSRQGGHELALKRLVSTVQFCPSAPSFHYLRDSELVLHREVAPEWHQVAPRSPFLRKERPAQSHLGISQSFLPIVNVVFGRTRQRLPFQGLNNRIINST